ncbi:MAG: TetR/AcrR family transcriptional regulator [Aquihabitans sp.]
MARPRSEEAHRAALDTTVELLLEGGIEGVTLDEVAARSGVAKSTLYRHFGSRDDLITMAARCCVVEHPTPDTGSLASDLEFLFDHIGKVEEQRKITGLLSILIESARWDPAMEELRDQALAERRRPIRTVLQLAQLRGEIGPHLDLDAAVAMVVGPFTYRRMIERQPVTPEFAEMVLHGAVAALKATADRAPV